jgi:VIT1/CCC1 family predicted Fe2+/Mn2+ transporter
MATGEYVATKSQEAVMDGEIELERRHIANHKQDELKELNEHLTKIGISEAEEGGEGAELRRRLLGYYAKDDEALLKVNVALEFGIIEEERRSPFLAGFASFFLFLFGALPSVIPWIIVDNNRAGLIASGVATSVCLLLVGAIKTWATKGNLLASAAENLVIAAGGGAIAYGVGRGFDHLVNE